MGNNELPKDSGSKRQFISGAHRDNATGKGRCDLLPLLEVGQVMQDDVLINLGLYQSTKETKYIYKALEAASFNEKFGTLSNMMLEASILYEAGAIKYGENNWRRGMPTKVYLDSGVRHYFKTLRGDDDEPHHRGFVWNMLCLLWTIENVGQEPDVIE